MEYKKHFIPLESDPEVFTSLAHELGLSSKLRFEDVYTLEVQPAIAAILIWPTREDYDERIKEYHVDQKIETKDVIWLRQTINNACGLYSILHAMLNGRAVRFLEHGSFAEKLLHMTPKERTDELESSQDLENIYRRAAQSGSTDAPDDPTEDVDYHYVAFVTVQGHLYELDGDQSGAIDRGELRDENEGSLGSSSIEAIKTYVDDMSGSYCLLKLVEAVDNFD